MDFAEITALLEDQGCEPAASLSGDQYLSAKCPAHSDSKPSLSVTAAEDGRLLVYCHALCSIDSVCQSLGISVADLFHDETSRIVAAYYIYTDESGQPLYRVVRYQPKGFSQERYDGGVWRKGGVRGLPHVPYNLPHVVESPVVWIVEGEKDVDNLQPHVGHAVTTVLGGAGKWEHDYAQYFRGKEVVIVGDSDEAGRRHVAVVRRGLEGVASSIAVRYPAYGKDVTDHLLAGHTIDELEPEILDLSELAPLDWRSYQAPQTEWLLKPYIPRGVRVLAFGPKQSLKSLWALWLGTHVANEGGRVAYFSLEMRPTDMARRAQQANPNRRNFHVFTTLKFDDPRHIELIRHGLKGYDLIIVDSWTAAHQGATNDEVARLDNEVFLPIIEKTGATLLILDNTGHPFMTQTGDRVKTDWARGASAKGDKVEVELMFDRPDPQNGYRTRIKTTKMRLDHPMPPPVVVETPQDRVEFYVVEDDEPGRPMWPSLQLDPEGGSSLDLLAEDSSAEPVAQSVQPVVSMQQSPEERRRWARLQDKLRRQSIDG